MNSGQGRPTDGATDSRDFIVSSEALHRILVSLTVVHGRVQLLRRHIRQHGTPGGDDLEAALAPMEEASRAMATELWTIMGALPGTPEEMKRRSSRTPRW